MTASCLAVSGLTVHVVSFIGDTDESVILETSKEAFLINCLVNVVIMTSGSHKGAPYDGYCVQGKRGEEAISQIEKLR